MITRITGKLVSLSEVAATIDIGAFHHEVLVPEFVRRRLQSKIGDKIDLCTIEYIEGNPQRGRLTPRLVGFMSDVERQFFDMVCSVDGVGVKKTLRAMVRPVAEVATAIEEQDIKQLSTLPGIGPAVAERIVAKLRRKMARFALMVSDDTPGTKPETSDVLNDAYEALLALGHSASEARTKIDAVLESGKKMKTVEDVLSAVYKNERS
ncbi:MAG: Holliday junction branch migration protein RuvA [Planctomycetaceae bacterium]